MTNAEKFKEVFGFAHHNGCPFPVLVCATVEKMDCKKCPFERFWEKEYKECFELDMDKVKELIGNG